MAKHTEKNVSEEKKNKKKYLFILLLLLLLIFTTLILAWILGKKATPGNSIDSIELVPGTTIHLCGYVYNTDKVPLPHMNLELHSEPRKTKTDENGRFTYPDVELGEHLIKVLDDENNVLAECGVTITEADVVRLLEIQKNQYLLEVSVAMIEVEIEIYLGEGGMELRLSESDSADGKESGSGSEYPGEERAEDSSVQPVAVSKTDSKEETEEIKENVTQVIDYTENSEDKKDETEESEEDSSGSSTPSSEGNVKIFSEGKQWTQETTIDPFQSTKLVYPGMNGTYQFQINNSRNEAVTFQMTIVDEHTNKIPFVFRIKDDGGNYVGGTEAGYVESASLQTVTLPAKTAKTYTLEWLWQYENGTDAHDTSLGNDQTLTHPMKVTIYAETK